MKKSFCVICVWAALFPVAAVAQARDGTRAMPEVAATGRGEIRVAPDRAVIVVAVESRMPTAAAAASDNAERVGRTFQAIQNVGIVRSAITTSEYVVAQNYEENSRGRRPQGFLARTSVRVDVREIANVGKVIDAALAGGATQISAVQFQASNIQELRRRALALATTEAQQDAESIAGAAGGRLGRVLAVTSGGSAMPLRNDVYLTGAVVASGAASPTILSPGELTVTAVASGRWEFLSGSR
jgi:uncharacterized protein YggE